MTRKCQISKKKRRVENKVSHSKRRTKTVKLPNLQEKRFFLEEENRWVKLKVSTRIIRTISKFGLAATLKKYGLSRSALN